MTTQIENMTRNDLKAAIPAHPAWKEYREAAGITKRIGEMTRAELETHAAALGITEAPERDASPAPAPVADQDPAPVATPAPAPAKVTDPLASLRPILSGDILKNADAAIAAMVADLDAARAERDAARQEAENAAFVPAAGTTGHRARKVAEKTVAELIGSRAQIAQNFMLDVCDHPDAPAIDGNYVWDAERLSYVAAAVKAKRNVALWGDRGTGKSSFVRMFAAITRRPYFEISFHGESSGTELFGTYGIEGDGMAWVPGDLLVAMQTPYAVIDLSEISASRADLVMQLNAVLEDGSRAVFVGGKRHPVHPTVTFFATSNDNGSGEQSHRFVGVRAMNDATRSRFIWMELNLPGKAQFADMLAGATGLPKPAAKMLAEWEIKMRDHVKNASAETTPGLRAWKSFGLLVKEGVPVWVAFAMAVEHVSSTEDGAVWRQDLNNFDCERFEKLARGETIPAPDASPVDPTAAPATRHGFTATA